MSKQVETPWYRSRPHKMSRDCGNIGFSLVDRFLIVAPSPNARAPREVELANLADLISVFQSDYHTVLDFTRPGVSHRDYATLLDLLGRDSIQVLTSPETFSSAIRLPFYDVNYVHLNRGRLPFRYQWIASDLFGDFIDLSGDEDSHYRDDLYSRLFEWQYDDAPEPSAFPLKHRTPVLDKYDRSGWPEAQLARFKLIGNLLSETGINAFLNQIAIQLNGENITASAYHQHAIYPLSSSNHRLLSQPSILAKQTNALISPHLAELSDLLNDRKVKEHDIQRWLERNEAVFSGLGYAQVRAHVVLERQNDGPLIPDFFVRPVGTSWWDILDIKLPTSPITVGSANRLRLSAQLHEVAAQLREYQAYFENDKYSANIESRFGIKCYRPKLVALIGNRLGVDTDRQQRRLLTAYPDLTILDFDTLYDVAKSRLLI